MKVVIVASLLIALSACTMGTEPARTAQTPVGPALADAGGMTL